jgi:hypothetical protein
MKYRFQMLCPRCNAHTSDTVSDKRKPPAIICCERCRSNDGVSVEMKILAIEVTESEAKESD